MVGMKSESSSNHLKSASLDCPSCEVASNGELLATMIFWETRKSDMGLSLGQLGFENDKMYISCKYLYST